MGLNKNVVLNDGHHFWIKEAKEIWRITAKLYYKKATHWHQSHPFASCFLYSAFWEQRTRLLWSTRTCQSRPEMRMEQALETCQDISTKQLRGSPVKEPQLCFSDSFWLFHQMRIYTRWCCHVICFAHSCPREYLSEKFTFIAILLTHWLQWEFLITNPKFWSRL